jgi:antitoxin PrlF
MPYRRVRIYVKVRNMATGTLTSKGQITVPKEIRDYLKLRPGHRLEFQITREGAVFLRPRNRDVRELKGIVHSPHAKPVTVEEMNQAIADRFRQQ